MSANQILPIALLLIHFGLASSCAKLQLENTPENSMDTETETASDGDVDGDTDTDTDTDVDGDADGDTDGDADGDTDGDVDGDTDGDTDGDADGDTDGDADGDTDSDTDSDTDTETESINWDAGLEPECEDNPGFLCDHICSPLAGEYEWFELSSTCTDSSADACCGPTNCPFECKLSCDTSEIEYTTYNCGEYRTCCG